MNRKLCLGGLGARTNHKTITRALNHSSLRRIYTSPKRECVHRIIEYIIDSIGSFVDKINIGFKDISSLLL